MSFINTYFTSWRNAVITAVTSVLFLTSFPACADTTQSALLISDIHFNPFSACVPGANSCEIITKLQQASAKNWANIFQQYDIKTPSGLGNDTDYALLASTVNYLQSFKQSYGFVIVTGDFLAHGYQSNYQAYTGDVSVAGYQKFVTKTYEFLALQLHQAFPDTPVYSTIGNNDSFGGDYYSDPNGPFYQALAKIWQPLIRDSNNIATFKATFPYAGYYVVTPPNAGKNELIVLNSVLFSAKATGSATAPRAATQQLAWLEQQLKQATANGQHVWLAYHIADGADVFKSTANSAAVMLWKDQYNKQFLALLNKYKNTVTDIISAHVHMDGFQWINHGSGKVLNIFTPAVSPVYNNNPAFKIAEFDPKSFTLDDTQTYYLDVQDLNNNWDMEYDFTQSYQPDCPACTLAQGYEKIHAEGWRTDLYRNYYSVGTSSQPITQGDWMPFYWCGIHYQTDTLFQKCIVKGMVSNHEIN